MKDAICYQCLDNEKLIESGEMSDGYHTFNELYEHRHALWINLCHLLRPLAFKTHGHSNPEDVWDGWFILGINHPVLGQITYHLPEKYWQYCHVSEVSHNAHYDNHTSHDVIERLLMLSQPFFKLPEL